LDIHDQTVRPGAIAAGLKPRLDASPANKAGDLFAIFGCAAGSFVRSGK
jgi:hypothetical protein